MPHKRKCGIHSRGSNQPHSRWACAALPSFIPPNLFTSHTFVARFWRNFTLLIDILPLFCSDFANSNVPVLIFTNKPIFGPKDGIARLNSFLFALIWKWQKTFDPCSTWKGPWLASPSCLLQIGGLWLVGRRAHLTCFKPAAALQFARWMRGVGSTYEARQGRAGLDNGEQVESRSGPPPPST